ncbi:type II secretion system F family protein [Kitasatospora arboriphila]|uniref:Type II secretion system protein GspF domain-containing protein n=1 Tax=Kitasatospora arboriphila TaxID=258052 RepID=A0ABN1U4V4_9ACTN
MIALLLGGGFGAGAWLWWTGLRPPRPTLAEALNRRAAPVRPRRAPLPRGAGWAARAGAPLVPALLLCRLPGTRLAADLRTLGIPAERHLAEKAGAAMAGLLIPWGPALLTAAAGSTGFAFPAWTALLLAALLFCTPDLAVRRKAERYRAEMRQALSAFLDLVVVALSGGAGVEQALADAASAGQGPAFTALRGALREAEVTRTAPWGPLGRLGERTGVAELPELAATVALAGSEGAKVKASLTSKAATLRGHLLAEAEAEAAGATERMSLPVVTLFAGFLLFIGYPALTHALTGL